MSVYGLADGCVIVPTGDRGRWRFDGNSDRVGWFQMTAITDDGKPLFRTRQLPAQIQTFLDEGAKIEGGVSC